MVNSAALGVLVWLGMATSASALILTGGPRYVLPGGGSCLVSAPPNDIPTRNTGATVTCSGVNLGAHTNVYFGIKNAEDTVNPGTDINPNGTTMNATTPSGGAIFRYASNTASSVTYTSTTTIDSLIPAFGSDPVTNTMVVSITSGSATILPTSGNPANSLANGDIERVFRLDSGSSFTFNIDINASTPHFNAQACTGVYDPTHADDGNGGCRSRVDLAFYFSDCGDSVVDSPEDCDLGGGNGDADTCCTSTCTFRPGGEVCRPGPGAPCDANETCTGSNANCPSDDAPINGGVVCRPGSGDPICDQNETCTGTPGQGCPADDAPGQTSVICRLSTTGDVCDEDELCTGVPGAVCPVDDAFSKLNFPCRPGSGDVCDPTEHCIGLPGAACPADVVANPSTVCRAGSGDSCDPNEFCTAIPTQPCPGDVVQSAGFDCRPAVDICDVTEECTGNAGQPCPANGFANSGTSCNEDADQCTVDECDGSGNCVFDSNLDCNDGNNCTQDSCIPASGCDYDGAPSNSCAAAGKALFKYKDTTDAKDNIKFLWKGGPPALVIDMGDPTDTTTYELCVYDNNGPQLALAVPPGMGWSTVGSPSSPKGYKFKDAAASLVNDGVKLIKTKASSLPNKAKFKLSGKGNHLPDTATLDFDLPVTAQLYASDGACWEAVFDDPAEVRKNETGGFIGKLP